MRFRGIKLVGLLVVALGVMAIGAGVAHAEEKAKWLVNGAAVTTPVQVQSVGGGIEGNDGYLLAKSGLSLVEILCTEVEFIDGLIKEKGGSSVKALLFKNCKSSISGKEASNCNPTTPGSTAGHITTKPLVDLLVLHNSGAETLDEVKPETGTVFAEFTFGEKCAFGNKINVTGVGFLKDCEGAFLTEKAVHLVTEEKTLSKLLFGANEARLDGSNNVQLVGGGNWSGHAG